VSLPFGAQQRVSDDTTALYAVVRLAIEKAGGIDWLTSALDREPSYVSKISEGLNRREGRHAHLDWLAPLLSDPIAARELLTGLCGLCGYEPPQRRRVATREEVAAAVLDVLAEAGEVGEALRERVARRLGTDVGAVRL
jgi:16S rRNA C967 or C1407 C5-methylase (RsmB/RsmF family)